MERTNELEKELCSFPSYLNSFVDLGTCSKKMLKQILDRIAFELETYDSEIEKIRDLNLIAFLHHELGVKETALQYVDQALSSNDKSINALALKGWFYLKSVDIYECKKILKQLGPLRNVPKEMLHAKAEVAYIYTRLGIKFYDKAIAMFKSIFSEIDKNSLTVDSNTFVVWKFGLALTMKRTLNFANLHEENKFDFKIEKVIAVLKKYSEIYESQTDSRYRARSLVEMGELVNNISRQGAVHGPQANSDLLKNPVEEYFKEALDLCDSDPFVLQRCGKYYRYQKDYDKSIELLRKSIEGKNYEYNSYGHHHLALSLKKKLEHSLRTTERAYSVAEGPDCGSFDVTSEFKQKLNLSTGANTDHYSPQFSKGRTKARSNRCKIGRSQSRPSSSTQRFEGKNKATRLYGLLVKSPQKVLSLKGTEKCTVEKILEHLDKAYQISGNEAALYDKGLTLRALDRYDDAINVFKMFIEKDFQSLVHLANAYEQSAFCMISKLEMLPNLEEREIEKINYNLEHYLRACIEISYRKIKQKHPVCNYCWASQKVLEDILKKRKSLKEVWDFYREVQDFTKSINVAENLLKQEGDQEEQRAIRMKMVSDYYNLQQYDKAILTINLIGNQMDDLPLFSEVHFEGGLQAYMRNEFELAKIRLRTALTGGCGKIQGVSDEEEEVANNFDIFILCSESNEDCPRQVKHGLENLGLQVTVNFDDLRLFKTKSTGVVEVMKNSSHFICFLEQDNNSEGDEQMLNLLEVVRDVLVKRGSGQILFIKRDQLTDIPTNFMHCPSIQYDDNMANVAKDMKMEETQIQWLKSLLQVLVRNTNRAISK